MITASLVLFHNPREQIELVIQSVINSVVPIHLFCIDNSSSAEHFSWLVEKLRGNKDKYKNIKYQFMAQNLGFGQGHNQVLDSLKDLSSEYHLILNPDVIFGPQVISELVDFMNQNPDVALTSPKVVYPDGKLQHLCRLIPNPYHLLIRRFGIQSLTKKSNEQYELRHFNYNEVAEVPILSGCFMFFRSSVFLKLKGFDPRFFMYLEDFDISRRALKFGKNIFNPKVIITHDYGRGSYRSTRLLVQHIFSAVKYFNKWGWFFDSERRQVNQRTLLRLDKAK